MSVLRRSVKTKLIMGGGKKSKKLLRNKVITREETLEQIGDALETDIDRIQSHILPQEDDGPDSTQVTNNISTPSSQQSKGVKRKRGATKMKNIALDTESLVDIKWTEGGEPIRKGSISLSSFLGPLVREIVPVTLADWRKRSSQISHILWKTIQVRYNVDQEWKKDYIFHAMGCLFRSSKSALVRRIREASNEDERLKLRPGNIKKVEHWRHFVRMKTSTKFKEKLEKIESASPSSVTTSVKENALSQVLRQDAMGRLRGMGRGMTHTKLALILTRNKHVTQLQETQIQMAQKITALESLVESYMNNQSYQVDKQANLSSPLNVNTIEKKCEMLDWTGSGDIVVEGRWCSSDPKVLVNHIPLGPNAMQVLVDIAREPEAHLWRPTAEMISIEEAIGNIVAWPSDKIIMNTNQKNREHENVSSPSVEKTDSNSKCKLLDWSGSGEAVADGR